MTEPELEAIKSSPCENKMQSADNFLMIEFHVARSLSFIVFGTVQQKDFSTNFSISKLE